MKTLYTLDRSLNVDQFIDLLNRTSLGERRPLSDLDRVRTMLAHADLLATAWHGDTLIGIARAITDFSYCCYLSDLAVDETYQRQGVGKGLIALLQTRLHPEAKIILIAAPAARDYYGKIGFEAHPSAWTLPAKQKLS